MKRKIGEVFEDYRKRLKEEKKSFVDKLRGRFITIPITRNRTGKNSYLPQNMKYIKAYKKKHDNESLSEFKDRRMFSNRKRRLRESTNQDK